MLVSTVVVNPAVVIRLDAGKQHSKLHEEHREKVGHGCQLREHFSQHYRLRLWRLQGCSSHTNRHGHNQRISWVSCSRVARRSILSQIIHAGFRLTPTCFFSRDTKTQLLNRGGRDRVPLGPAQWSDYVPQKRKYIVSRIGYARRLACSP